ncbi:MAG: GHKL domain-containing protein [Oscillospiraceae bacterium]
MNVQDMLSQYLVNVLYSPKDAILNLDEIPENEREFAEKLQQFCEAVMEAKQFSDNLSDGDIYTDISGENPFVGSLKELQAGLRHFQWQAIQVTNGDYSQRADFLGKFSDVFNEMKRHLLEREELARKNHELEVKIVKHQKTAFKQQLEQQESYYHYIMDMHNRLRAVKHDIQNHYLCIDSLLAAGKVKEAREYLHPIFDALNAKSPTINTDNYMLDVLLTEKMRTAKENNIKVEYSLDVRPKLKVENFDWCIMLGNAMDNAIEACLKIANIDERKIYIKAKTNMSMLNIAIRNTAIPPQKVSAVVYATTKKDKENHGLGLKNISKTVETYGGVVQTNYNDGYFTIKILLCNV